MGARGIARSKELDRTELIHDIIGVIRKHVKEKGGMSPYELEAVVSGVDSALKSHPVILVD